MSYNHQLLGLCDIRQKRFAIRPFPSPPAALERMRTFLKLRSSHSSRTGSLKARQRKKNPEPISSSSVSRLDPEKRTETHLGSVDGEKCTHASGCVRVGPMRPLVRIFLAARLTHVTHICISVPNTHHRLIFAAAACPRETSFSAQSIGTLAGQRPGRRGKILGGAPLEGRASAAPRRTARRPVENFGRPKKIGDAQHARDGIYVEAERVPRQSARPPESHQREKRARPGARPAAAATTTATAANTTGSTRPSLSRGHAVGTARTQRSLL